LKPVLAIHALEGLIAHSNSSRQILTALRCLVRLRFTVMPVSNDKVLVI
jgi:hypothetical protein